MSTQYKKYPLVGDSVKVRADDGIVYRAEYRGRISTFLKTHLVLLEGKLCSADSKQPQKINYASHDMMPNVRFVYPIEWMPVPS